MALPKDVQSAVAAADAAVVGCDDTIGVRQWQTIRAHLLSQDAEIERLQSGLAAADAMLEATERTLERCKQTLDTTSECWRLDSERLEAAERDAARYRWLRGGDSRLAVCDEDTSYYLEQLDAIVDAATQEGEG